jgi:NAD(P)-dependent dehydrogenase (short-subunit alcohol dehydrogenase family)
MGQKLMNKAAVVTGAGSGGIGRSVAMALAREGANVVVNDIGRDAEGNYIADKVVREITAMNVKAVSNYDSVTSLQGARNMVAAAVDSFGKIDILVNCAGNFKRAPTMELSEEAWKSIIDVHLNGHFNCCKAALAEMVKQKGGRLINFSSRAASGGGGNLAYSAAKAGILGFTSMLAAEFKDSGITANVIVPSADTKLFPGARPKMPGETMPSSLWLDPDYIAPVVAYLATDAAAKVTGQYIYASGGDVCIYPRILQMPGSAPVFVRKLGKWTIDELEQVLPPLMGLS